MISSILLIQQTKNNHRISQKTVKIFHETFTMQSNCRLKYFFPISYLPILIYQVHQKQFVLWQLTYNHCSSLCNLFTALGSRISFWRFFHPTIHFLITNLHSIQKLMIESILEKARFPIKLRKID